MILHRALLLVFAVVAMTGALQTKWPAQPGFTHQEPVITKSLAMDHFNRLRDNSQPLAWDEDLATWLEDTIPVDAQVEDISIDTLLDKLQEGLPALAAASAGVFRVPSSGPTFYRELDQWIDARDNSYTHVALITRKSITQVGLTNTWAILATRFPDFSPDKLVGDRQEFHHVCARCNKDYNGRFTGGDRILLLRCPHCDETHDILALSTANQYQRVNSFMQGFEPKAHFPVGISKLKQLKLIWHTVLDHCQYANDTASRYTFNKDFWQDSQETFGKQSGDCEDTSILLADWLNQRGIEARVVIGETSSLLGHAWCVARVQGITYLLETTLSAKDGRPLRPVVETKDEYRPDYQFDREHLYFRQSHKAWITDYWSEQLWKKVNYPSSKEPMPVDRSSWGTKGAWFPSPSETSEAVSSASPSSTAGDSQRGSGLTKG
jgi:hypothetical protein